MSGVRDEAHDSEAHRQNLDDFSDIVHGEELEFRKSPGVNFPVTYRLDFLGAFSPARVFSSCSANQLVMISGAASGFLAGVMVCPLDVVKTRAQYQGQSDSRAISGIVGVMKDILRQEGIAGLYRGLVPITIGYLPTWTIYFAVYERAKAFYPYVFRKYFDSDVPAFNHFLSAITAGAASTIAVNPVWVVKTRLMIQTSRGHVGSVHDPSVQHRTFYKSTLDAFRTMYREEGMRVFYSGLVPSVFGLVHVGIHFPVYEKLKDLLHCNIDPQKKATAPHHMLLRLILASTVSKMTASTVTYPHEILRTRLQVQQAPGNTAKDHKIKSLVSSIYQKEGIRGFYSGYFVNLLRTVPASAVTLVSFEYFKTYLLEITGKSSADI